MNLDERAIAQYLADNPDFFSRHEDVLLKLQLRHASGQAVSLIEKQVSALRERNTELRHKLNLLLANARDNDRLFEQSKRLVLALMESEELGDLVDALYYAFDKDFAIPFSSLVLFEQPSQPTNVTYRPLREAEVILGRNLLANRAVSGGLNQESLAFLFGREHKNIGSAAMVPLYYNRLMGAFALGHPDPNHFQSGMGTLFLTHIGEVLDRLLPKFI